MTRTTASFLLLAVAVFAFIEYVIRHIEWEPYRPAVYECPEWVEDAREILEVTE